jgi:hypothetical protein
VRMTAVVPLPKRWPTSFVPSAALKQSSPPRTQSCPIRCGRRTRGRGGDGEQHGGRGRTRLTGPTSSRGAMTCQH